MTMSNAIAVATLAAGALLAGGASAQNAKATPAPMVFETAYEIALPGEGETATLKLAGLKTAHAAWVTFLKFSGGAPPRESPVISLMEGMTAKWAGGKETCIFELRLVASPPAITINRTSGMCNLKPPGNAVFSILAM